jgi:glycosyltransferase involved in cell wall biosynthesis
MRLIFVNWAYENHGSAQDIHNYARVARALGHEVVLYGPPNPASAFPYSLDVRPTDAVIFIFEFTTRLDYGEKMGLLRLVGQVPRGRRVVIDCDGKYNDALHVVGDTNHPDAQASSHWIAVCDSLSDKILQPTLHPLRPNVRQFFFHAYNPAWEVPLDFRNKAYGMVYVGNNWFRWRALRRVLEAVTSVRDQLGRLTLVGQGWDSRTPWGGPATIEEAYYTEPEYLEELGVEVRAPVRFDEVIDWMGQGVFSPVIYRPLFDQLQLVTCRTYETVAANTIPVFGQAAEFVAEVYGEEAVALVLPEEGAAEKIQEIVKGPEAYTGIVERMRRHLGEKYAYGVRLRELIQIVES